MKIFVGCDAAGCPTQPVKVDQVYNMGVGRPAGWWALDFEGPPTPSGARNSMVICPNCAERLGLVKLADDVRPKPKVVAP